MGIFRKHKSKDYDIKEAAKQVRLARQSVLKVASDIANKKATLEDLDAALFNWAEWRELLARLENQNDSDVV